jgi:hypothetical protein
MIISRKIEQTKKDIHVEILFELILVKLCLILVMGGKVFVYKVTFFFVTNDFKAYKNKRGF